MENIVFCYQWCVLFCSFFLSNLTSPHFKSKLKSYFYSNIFPYFHYIYISICYLMLLDMNYVKRFLGGGKNNSFLTFGHFFLHRPITKMWFSSKWSPQSTQNWHKAPSLTKDYSKWGNCGKRFVRLYYYYHHIYIVCVINYSDDLTIGFCTFNKEQVISLCQRAIWHDLTLKLGRTEESYHSCTSPFLIAGSWLHEIETWLKFRKHFSSVWLWVAELSVTWIKMGKVAFAR